MVILSILVTCTCWMLRSEDTVIERIEESALDRDSLIQQHREHQNSFGGVKNVLHPAGAKAKAAAEKGDGEMHYGDGYIKTSIVPHA
eukprot:3967118-Ditylum_brightwellii.AAC.1